MTCTICGDFVEHPELARHLPHFVRCSVCTGYVTEEKETVAYPKEYFAEESKKPKKSIFSSMFTFFLWLRMKKIQRILQKDATPFNPQKYPSSEESFGPALRCRAPALRELQAFAPSPSEEGRRRPCILDYGCGNGTLVAYLREKGFDADGYDPEPSAVALARKAGLPVFGTIPDKQYALIMLWHSLEHSETPLQDIRALKNHLTRSGRLLIAVPNGDGLEARFFGESFFCYDWPFHRVHFTQKALTILLEQAGFRVLSVDHFSPEYTVSSLVQTFLNLFLPKNVLYSFVSARRQTVGKRRVLFFALLSLLLLVAFSPVLALFFIFALLLKRTAAFIVVAERIAS